MKKIVVWISIPILLMSCAPKPASPAPTSPPSTVSEAQGVLNQFFERLNSRQYADADRLYGGDYEQLKIFSSDVDPSDHARLWSNACELAGLQCLKVRTAAFNNLQGNTYVFQVEFSNSDGGLFVLGPCCGSNATGMAPVSQFEYKVASNADRRYVVMDLPPYVP